MVKETENDWDSDPEGFFEKNKVFPVPGEINFKVPNLCFMKTYI